MSKFRLVVSYGKYFVEDNKDFPRYKQIALEFDDWISPEFADFLYQLKNKGVINDFVICTGGLPFCL